MTLPEVLQRIDGLYAEKRIPGWCPPAKAHDLVSLVWALRPRVVVETGVFGGKSLIPMALACRQVGGRVIGIDPWSPTASQEGYTGVNKEWWGALNHEDVYGSFLGNLERLQLQDVVEVRREKSLETVVPTVIDLFHCDSNHNEMAIAEVRRFCPNIKVGGIAVFDDLAWHNDGVQHVAQAIELLLSYGFVELHRPKLPSGEEWGVFQKIFPEEGCI